MIKDRYEIFFCFKVFDKTCDRYIPIRFHNTSGGMKQRPGSYPGAGGYDDDGRYGSRDDDRNGYGREREYSYGDERSGRDRYRDDEYRGRRSVDGDSYGRRSRSSDRDRERAYADEGPYSSRYVYTQYTLYLFK